MTVSHFERVAERCARREGWKKSRAAGYWMHRDHATFDGPAAELCKHYRIQIIEGGELVLDPNEM